jgi:hypothetical protein
MLQFWSNFIILLKSDLSIPQKLKLSCSLRYDQIYINHYYSFGHTLLCCSSQTLDIPKKFKISCSIRCDQIHNSCFSNFGHTLVQHKWPTNQLQLLKSCLHEAGLLNKRPSLAVALGVTKFLEVIVTNLVTLYCTAQVSLRYSTNPSFWMLLMELASFSK